MGRGTKDEGRTHARLSREACATSPSVRGCERVPSREQKPLPPENCLRSVSDATYGPRVKSDILNRDTEEQRHGTQHAPHPQTTGMPGDSGDRCLTTQTKSTQGSSRGNQQMMGSGENAAGERGQRRELKNLMHERFL